MEKKSYLYVELEHNLESECSHQSPDWVMSIFLKSIKFSIDLRQYVLVRGILEKNLSEKFDERSQPTFLMPNTLIETVLTGEIWKCVCINLDLLNVGIELMTSNIAMPSSFSIKERTLKKSIAFLSLIKSSLIYESYSDGSKLLDFFSSEIKILDTTDYLDHCKKERNVFVDVLCNPRQNSLTNQSKRLQLEIHYRSNKISNR